MGAAATEALCHGDGARGEGGNGAADITTLNASISATGIILLRSGRGVAGVAWGKRMFGGRDGG